MKCWKRSFASHNTQTDERYHAEGSVPDSILVLYWKLHGPGSRTTDGKSVTRKQQIIQSVWTVLSNQNTSYSYTIKDISEYFYISRDVSP